MPFPLGWPVYGAGDRHEYLYFLTTGIVSRFYLTANGASAEFAVTGSEGVIGVASFPGGEYLPNHAVVLSAGYAYRLGADLVRIKLEHDSPMPRLLLRYTQALIAQTAQIALCNRHHSLQQQMGCWILSCLHRLPSNELTVTQEETANMLGVRRESLTEAAEMRQEAGLIHCGRGHIAVLDRSQLEARVCECYAVIKREYGCLLRPDNTVGNAGVHGTCLQFRARW